MMCARALSFPDGKICAIQEPPIIIIMIMMMMMILLLLLFQCCANIWNWRICIRLCSIVYDLF